MAGRKNWKNLMKNITPERKARIDQGVREEMAEMLLSEIRQLSGLTQQQLAASLGTKQPSLSQLESQSDMQISTLRRVIESLGGELEIIATLPGGRISLRQFTDESRKVHPA